MPSITFTMKDVNNAPVTFTQFTITAGFPDGGFDPEMELPVPSTHTTDSLGKFTVTLPATGGPYYLAKAGNRVSGTTAHKFFVPDVAGPLEADYLYVDLGHHQRLLNDASLLNLIETKVSVSNAAAMLEGLEESALLAKTAAETAQGLAQTAAATATTQAGLATAAAAAAAADRLAISTALEAESYLTVSTGSIEAMTEVTVTVPLGFTAPSTNYRVTQSVIGTDLEIRNLVSKGLTSYTVKVYNRGASSQTGSIEATVKTLY